MADIQVVSVGTVGPAGPGSVSPGAVITSRGGLIVGDATATPAELPVGASGTFVRSNGDDPEYSVILAADLPTAIDAVKLADGSVSNTEFQYLNGVTSAVQTQLDAKSATTHTHLDAATRGFFVAHEEQSTADADNTASATTVSTAMTWAFALPTGTWTVVVKGSLQLANSLSTSVWMRVNINGQDSTGRGFTVPDAPNYQRLEDGDDLAGCSGTVTIRVQFRGDNTSTPGTTYARNPSAVAFAYRTA